MTTKAYDKTVKNSRAYDAEAMESLRLQAKAWRIAAIVGTHDQAKGLEMVNWLIMNTFPNPARDLLERFITNYTTLAEDNGKKSGVFA